MCKNTKWTKNNKLIPFRLLFLENYVGIIKHHHNHHVTILKGMFYHKLW